MSNPERQLRRLLRANALFSGTCGLVFAIPTPSVPAVIGRPSFELLLRGLSLLLFAGFVGWLSTRHPLTNSWTKRLVASVVGLDVLWAVQAIVQVAGVVSFTSSGQWLFAGLALVVFGLAYGQGYALWHLHRRSYSSSHPEAPTQRA